MTIDQISVFVDNKPGRLVELLEVLSQSNVDLRAMSMADTADFGILRMIADNPENAKKLIADAGYVTNITQVLAVAVPDVPGGLAKVLSYISNAGISIEYMYVFITHEDENACVIVRVDDNEKAEKVLEANNIRLFSPSDIYKD